MTKREIYVAFDGVEFDDYFKCEEYERRMMANQYGNTLFVYDEDGEIIDNLDDYKLYNYSTYIQCYDQKAFNYINDIMTGYNHPLTDTVEVKSFPITIFYNEFTEEYEDLNEYVEKLQKELDERKKYLI